MVYLIRSRSQFLRGQLKVDDKSNEITAMPELMDSLNLKNTIITADALNTQKKTAAKAIDCGASFWEIIEKGHGRIETKSCMAISAKDLPSEGEWKGLNTIARICRTRKIGDKEESETTYYIGSLQPSAELVASVARKHWGVENNLHGG